MFALERQKRILELLNQNGSVSVSKLSAEFSITEETVRRDLEKLEKQEQLLRTHGGAVPIDSGAYELSLEKRKNTNTDIKEKLAKIAAEQVYPGDTVFLDASTTTFFMARELKKMKNITIITNSIRVINELSSQSDIKVIAVGGLVSNNQSFVGSMAENTIEENYFANKMFFSSKGLTLDGGVLESNEQECAIKQKMIKNSGNIYYMCDKSKFGRIGFSKLITLDKLNYLITDGDFDDNWTSAFDEMDVKVLKTE